MKYTYLDTSLGRIKGLDLDQAYVFKGIPYAITERFRDPVMIEKWDEELDATRQETDCYQFACFRDASEDFYLNEFYTDKEYVYAESPMTLTITAPKTGENLPVLVFIHGGGWENGCVGDLPYGDCYEYARRGIILVSVGYRLNVFSLYENGNYGLKDQLCAINWVHKYIGDFRGNPDMITLMGQSAGAMSIMDLTFNRLLEGKIKGIVTMSGGGVMPKMGGPNTMEQAHEFWGAVRKRAGVDEKSVYDLDVSTLWNSWYDESRENYSSHNVVPGIDGTIIPDVPQDILKRGEDIHVPAIMGVCSQDFMAPIMYQMALRYGLRASRRKYPPVYCYYFDRILPGNRYKAFHGADLWYMFGNLEMGWRPFGKTDYDLCAMMIDYVSQFVKTQNPNGPDLPQWKPISALQRGFRWLDGVSTGHTNPIKAFAKTIKSFTKDKGPM